MRRYFANWAAHNSADMDYLTRDQWERGLLEITLAGDWGYYRHDSVTHNLQLHLRMLLYFCLRSRPVSPNVTRLSVRTLVATLNQRNGD